MSRLILLSIAAALLSMPLLAQEANPVGAVESIVVGGAKREEATSSEAFVIRTRTGQTEPARRGLELYPDDELRTGNATQVVLIFFDNPNQKSNQATVDASSRVRLVRPNAILLRLGRVLASVRGLFDVATELVVLAARGTLFEAVASQDGTADLLVLDGAVEGLLAPLGGAPVEGEMAFAAPPGRVVTTAANVTITNQCDQRVRFEIRPPQGMGWISFPPRRVEVRQRQSATVRIDMRLDATGLAPGTYRGELLALCQNCGRVRGCTQDRFSFPVAVNVAPPAVRIVGRQQALFRPGLPGAPAPADPARFRGVIDLNSRVAVPSRPTHPPEGQAPYFANLAQRQGVLNEAVFRALANDDARAWEDYGDLYLDWSDPPKALDAYRKAAAFDRSRLQSPAYLTKAGEALRGIGELDEAQRALEAALAGAPNSARALNALAAVHTDRARIALDQGDPAGARRFLESALAAAQRSLQSDPAPPAAWSNLGEAHWMLGEIERLAQPGRAGPAYDNGVSAFNTALTRSAQHAFAQVGLARSYHSIGLAAQARGERTTADGMFAQARGGYNRAAAAFPDLAPAWTGLGNLARDTDPGNPAAAIEMYRRAIAARPRDPAPYFQMADLLQRFDPRQADRYFRLFRSIERPPFLQGERGRRAGADTRPLVVVPALRGLKERPARELIARSNLAVGRVDTRPSTASKGTVIEQRPADAARAPAGSAVDIMLAGDGRLAVPDVVGRTRDQALAALSRDFRVEFKEDRASAPAGIVFRQKPAAGQMEKPGKKVEVYVSRGGRSSEAGGTPQPPPPPPPLRMPDLIGMPESRAVEVARSMGLDPRIDYRAGANPGLVVDQRPLPREPVQRGGAIYLAVATRSTPPPPPPPPLRMPDLIGMPESRAVEVARSMGLDPRIDYRAGANPGLVVDQRPLPREPVQRGGAVYLAVATRSTPPPPPPPLRMPDLIGMAESRAVGVVRSLGLNPRVTYQPGKNPGMVLDQRPLPKQPVQQGAAIALVVAEKPVVRPPPPLLMKDFRGLRRADAEREARNLGLRVVTNYKYINGRQIGRVVDQRPSPGAPYRRGDTVTLSVEEAKLY